MLQVRKLVLAVAAATAFSSSFTHALGLGDLSVKSSLNQPLEAEISLLEVRDLTSMEIRSQLASPEEFSKAGVDRQFFLSGLKFTPMIDANGKSVIRVTSSKPVKEPYLNFLVEVLWPNGRLLREYTLLLDPPLYAPQQVIYAPQPAVTTASSVQPATQQLRHPQPIVRTTAPSAAAPTSGALQGTEYRVQKNDTLWDIATRVGGNASVNQTMLAIQDLNPDAFLGGNINRMKNGQVLRLPSAQDISSRSRTEASAQVAQQNSSWKTERSAPALALRQLDATHRKEAGAAPAEIEKTDSLRLIADTPGQAQQAADQGSGSGANLNALQDQLALNKERLDSIMLENDDLKGRVDDLNSQLEKLQRLIELKDNQLAQLQNAVDSPVELDVVENLADTELSADNELAQVDPELVEPADVASAEVIEELEVEQDVTLEQSAEELAEEAEQATELEPVVADLDANIEAETEVAATESEAQVEPVAAVAVVQPEAEEKSFVDSVMDEPMLLAAAGGGAVLALLLLLMGVSRSRARKEAELYDDQLSPTYTPDQAGSTETEAKTVDTDLFAATDASAQEENDPFAGDFVFEEPTAEVPFKTEESDPIAEATSYISFGRFTQAANVLNSAIEQEPERIDLRLKLVEVLADLEDHAGFSQQINEITEMGGASSQLEQIKAHYPQMFGEQVASVSSDDSFADFDLGGLTLDTPEDATATTAAELDAELDDLSALLADSESADKTTVTPDFDFDLDLSKPVASAAETAEQELDSFTGEFSSADKDNLALDIDSFSFDLDTPKEAEKISIDDEFSFDDLTLDLADSPSAEISEFELPENFDSAMGAMEKLEQADTDFSAQLDEVSAELDTLSASLTDEVVTETAKVETELDELSFDSTDVLTAVATDATLPLSDLESLGDLEDLDGIEDDFSFLSGTDETATKLDLARAYIDMGDAEGARDILDEVIAEGTATQQDEARELVARLG